LFDDCESLSLSVCCLRWFFCLFVSLLLLFLGVSWLSVILCWRRFIL
jgi:hypothetical protein